MLALSDTIPKGIGVAEKKNYNESQLLHKQHYTTFMETKAGRLGQNLEDGGLLCTVMILQLVRFTGEKRTHTTIANTTKSWFIEV